MLAHAPDPNSSKGGTMGHRRLPFFACAVWLIAILKSPYDGVNQRWVGKLQVKKEAGGSLVTKDLFDASALFLQVDRIGEHVLKVDRKSLDHRVGAPQRRELDVGRARKLIRPTKRPAHGVAARRRRASHPTMTELASGMTA